LDTLTFGDLANSIELYKPGEDLTPLSRHQPYYKLHGSIDLKQSDRDLMLIIGSNKAANIDEQPLLKSYHRVFEASLRLRVRG
jgi:hypothetical protein